MREHLLREGNLPMSIFRRCFSRYLNAGVLSSSSLERKPTLFIRYIILHIWTTELVFSKLFSLRRWCQVLLYSRSSWFVYFLFIIIIIMGFFTLEFNIALGGNFNKSNEYSTSKNWTTQWQKDPNDPRFDINIER